MQVHISSFILSTRVNHQILASKLTIIARTTTSIIRTVQNHFKIFKTSRTKTFKSNSFSLANLVTRIALSNQTQYASNSINPTQSLLLLSELLLCKLQTNAKTIIVLFICLSNPPILILRICMKYLVSMRITH